MAKLNQQIELIGDAALKRKLLSLSDKAANKIMRPAVAAGLKLIRAQAQQNATPGSSLSAEASGLMKKAIKSSTKARKDSVTGKVFVSRSVEGVIDGKKHVPGNVAGMVEFGHGGPAPAPAHPFMRPALDTKRGAALSAVTAKAREELEKEAKR